MNSAYQFDLALRAPDPGKALRALALEFASEGRSKSEVYDLFEKFLLHLREAKVPREFEEDIVMDIMDALTGWCHPDARLLSDS